MKRLSNFLALLVSVVWLLSPGQLRAQTASPIATLTAVDTEAFPAMRAFVQVQAADGRRLADLPASAFALSENATPLSGLSVSQQAVGVQMVVVLDPTDPFKARDVNGVARLEHVKQALLNWAEVQFKDDLDDLSVLTPETPPTLHLSTGSAFRDVVNGYTSTFAGAADPFPLLNQALALAAETAPRPGMSRFVVFFSGGLNANVAGALADVTARATAANVRVLTVYVGPAGSEATVGAQNLRQLAVQTGGSFTFFDGAESLDALWAQLADAGWRYELRYRSRLALTGQHNLAATLTLTDGVMLTTTPVTFPLRVEAPALVTLDWPLVITRTVTAEVATPLVFEVPLQVDFPDGHTRALQLAELRVDGVVVDARTRPEGELTLVWPLSAYVTPGEHVVQVSATDELGLLAETLPATITVAITDDPAALPVATPVPGTPTTPPNYALFVAFLGGALLMLALGAGGWLWYRQRAAAAPNAEQPEAPVAAPLTPPPPAIQPLDGPPAPAPVPPPAPATPKPAPPRFSLPPLPLPSFRREKTALPQTAPRARAFLEIVVPGRGQLTRAPLELFKETMTLGRDPGLAQVVFPDRSVAPLHARVQMEGENFRLYDEGSVAGTWVNFEPITATEGYVLQHGDLINLGHVQLWFKRRDQQPGVARAIKTN